MRTRRSFLATSAATAGAVTVLPFRAGAAGHEGNTLETPAGPVVDHPVDHATFVTETPVATIVVDPVGDPASFTQFGDPDLVLVTHEHGGHYSAGALMQIGPKLIVNPAVAAMLPPDMTAEAIATGQSTNFRDIASDAIPAYNTTEGRLNFHPEGRDNGTEDPEEFAGMVAGDIEAKMGSWYDQAPERPISSSSEAVPASRRAGRGFLRAPWGSRSLRPFPRRHREISSSPCPL